MKISAATKAWLVDTGERVGFTIAEAGLGLASVELGHLPAIYGVLFAGALAALKAQLAKLVNGTVSPASLAPAQQPGQAEQDAPPDVTDAGGIDPATSDPAGAQPSAYDPAP